jgi:carboxypeptidase PM20D1
MATASPVSHLQELVRIPTVSHTDEALDDGSQFELFRATLERIYPRAHTELDREIVAEHSLLYSWKGRETGAPTVLMAHYDVVPASVEGWEHPPFSAELVGEGEDQVVWGRGTLDDKGALVAIMEAVEELVIAGFTPHNDVYLSFGHNEESYGSGAREIVSLLEARGIRPALVIDEGGAVVEGIFPGVTDPIAVVGVSEKGITSVILTVDQVGGHASTPPRETATVRLARAIQRLNDSPFPARLAPTTLEMIETLGAHARGGMRFVFTHLWLTKGIVRRIFGSLSDETRALTRTTAAVTQLSGSLAPNALAERASATVNIRIAVDSSVAEAVDHVRQAIDDDEVHVTIESPSEPSPVSPSNGPAWDAIALAIAEVYPGTIVTPYIMMAASDSRHFTRISDSVYRFSPFRMSNEERATLHAKNERMHVATWLRGIRFYSAILRSR